MTTTQITRLQRQDLIPDHKATWGITTGDVTYNLCEGHLVPSLSYVCAWPSSGVLVYKLQTDRRKCQINALPFHVRKDLKI